MELTEEGKRTIKKLDLLAKLSPELGVRILKELIADGVKEVKKRTPIDSASMVSTVRDEINEKSFIGKVIIGGIMALFSRAGKPRKMVNYAIFPEEGTSKQVGVHMLVRGVDAALTKKNSIARQAFNNWVNRFK